MYRRYYNEYEKRAQQIAETSKENRVPPCPSPAPCLPAHAEIKEKPALFGKLRTDDVLLLLVIWLLLKEEKKDMSLILALGFIFLCDFKL